MVLPGRGEGMSDEIVMYDSPEAAQKKTVTGWVSRHGRFWGDDQHGARWDGCTHLTCKCGNDMSKSWTACEACREKSSHERFAALPRVEWDGKTPLNIYGTDTYFFDGDDLRDHCEEFDVHPWEMEIVLCEPVEPYTLYADEFLEDCLPEDMDDILPDSVHEAAKAFNEAVKEAGPFCWRPIDKVVSFSVDKEGERDEKDRKNH